jgi:UDP-3-O-[3-hydroxymyristoyl] glucosamine N-acyltransferase
MKSEISPKAVIHPLAYIAPENVIIEEGVKIGPFCVIGIDGVNTREEYLLFGDHVLRESKGKVIIKKNSVLTNNNVVNFALEENNATILGENVVLGTMNIIGHNSIIGDHTQIICNVTILGHTTIGKNCVIGPSSTIKNRVVIGDNVTISMGAVVTQNVESGKRVTGNFAIDHDKFIENLKKMR